jgi:hypothetical protein
MTPATAVWTSRHVARNDSSAVMGASGPSAPARDRIAATSASSMSVVAGTIPARRSAEASRDCARGCRCGCSGWPGGLCAGKLLHAARQDSRDFSRRGDDVDVGVDDSVDSVDDDADDWWWWSARGPCCMGSPCPRRSTNRSRASAAATRAATPLQSQAEPSAMGTTAETAVAAAQSTRARAVARPVNSVRLGDAWG